MIKLGKISKWWVCLVNVATFYIRVLHDFPHSMLHLQLLQFMFYSFHHILKQCISSSLTLPHSQFFGFMQTASSHRLLFLVLLLTITTTTTHEDLFLMEIWTWWPSWSNVMSLDQIVFCHSALGSALLSILPTPESSSLSTTSARHPCQLTSWYLCHEEALMGIWKVWRRKKHVFPIFWWLLQQWQQLCWLACVWSWGPCQANRFQQHPHQ